MPGITLGWAGLDERIGGAMPGQLVTWIAAPNLAASYLLAKSSLAAHEQVLLVSMEREAVSTSRSLIGAKSRYGPWMFSVVSSF